MLRCGCGSLLWHFSAGSGKFSGLVLEPRDPKTQLDDVVRCLLLLLLLLLALPLLLMLVVGSCSCGNVIELSATTSFIFRPAGPLSLDSGVFCCCCCCCGQRDTQMLLLRDTLASTRYFSATCLQHLCGLSGLSRPCVHLLNRSQAKNYSQTKNPTPLFPTPLVPSPLLLLPLAVSQVQRQVEFRVHGGSQTSRNPHVIYAISTQLSLVNVRHDVGNSGSVHREGRGVQKGRGATAGQRNVGRRRTVAPLRHTKIKL